LENMLYAIHIQSYAAGFNEGQSLERKRHDIPYSP
jgi:hypothetical protein